MNLFKVFAEAFEPTGNSKIILCDGDCGNCYKEEHLNETCYGDKFCKECMFNFIAEQEIQERECDQ